MPTILITVHHGARSSPAGTFRTIDNNVAQLFQRFVHEVLRGLHFTYAYVDDVLIASGSLVKHVDRIRQVLQYFHDQGVVINPAKCKFGASELIGMASCPLEEKVAVFRNFPRPTTRRKLRELLGLVNLYHRFIPHCATILCCWV